jgi:hypothetical protein
MNCKYCEKALQGGFEQPDKSFLCLRCLLITGQRAIAIRHLYTVADEIKNVLESDKPTRAYKESYAKLRETLAKTFVLVKALEEELTKQHEAEAKGKPIG